MEIERWLKCYLRAGANVNIQNSFEATPIATAVFREQIDIIEILLQEGANPDIGHSDGGPPIVQAIMTGNKRVVEILLNKGADIDTQSKDGSSGLMVAAQKERIDLFLMLLRRGANPNLKDKDGQTVLEKLVYPDYSRIENDRPVHLIEPLLEAGADPVIEGKFGKLIVSLEDVKCTRALLRENGPSFILARRPH